jgi:hypothetical protein
LPFYRIFGAKAPAFRRGDEAPLPSPEHLFASDSCRLYNITVVVKISLKVDHDMGKQRAFKSNRNVVLCPKYRRKVLVDGVDERFLPTSKGGVFRRPVLDDKE